MACAALLLACGPGSNPNGGDDDGANGDGGMGTPGTLRIEPVAVEVTAEPGIPGEADFVAIYTNDDGQDEDVTGEATWTVNNSTLGTFSGGHFTSSTTAAGHSKVRAAARGKIAEADLTVRLRTVIIGPGADSGSPGKFGGADDPSRAPSLVYPSDGTLVPPNLNELEFHFMAGAGNTLFRWTYFGQTLQLEVYMSCQPLGGGCLYAPDESTWLLIAEAERGAAPGTWTVSGVDGSAPAGVGTAAPSSLGFGQDDIVGGLYYWNAGAGKVMRYDFGRRSQVAESYLDPPRAQATICVGCHQMSRDGKKIAFGIDFPGATYKVFDVANRTQFFSAGSALSGASFFAFNPDATQILASNGSKITWQDATSGAIIDDSLVDVGTMPDWSPDGTKMVYAKGSVGGPTGVQGAGLEVMTFDGAIWSAPAPLVPFAGQNNYYPAFSPDGGWVMYNQSPSNHDSYDSPDAQVWVVNTAGGAPMRLASASTGGDSWPKWAPDVQAYRGGSLMWFTFSSRRGYGLRQAGGSTAQVWMAAFDPAAAAAGEDGSFTAFWLPFQEASSGNHIAQWVTEVQRETCTADGECESGEFCEDGLCVPQIQ